ncbi:nucleoside triphosphate pyrophosphohydrolase [Idiomarina abyssalis]|nr:nucleoside triphosphate pyrophosphohydrolase [Idiomarina abyssalis]MDA6065846.1 nucleoside triphosphate pyrophosphohydrolase [Idiomarina abyssalis]
MKGMQQLQQVMAQLRDPESGCPWDLKQNMTSLIPYTIEETYEVVDAIQSGNWQSIKDELGDLLFQVVFYAQLAREEQQFELDDIAAHTADKLISRHPHVFGTDAERNLSDSEIKAQWEQIKQQERAKKDAKGSVFDDIPSQLPSVLKAAKLQKRAASVGFDWTEAEPVYAKVDEEIQEVKEATDQDHIEEEIGDLLFAVVNLARHKQVNPEAALQRANEKFKSRFQTIEQRLSEKGKHATDCNLDELEALWQQAKQG